MSRAIAVLVCLFALPVAAQPQDASKLFEEGRELAKQQKWADACDRFQRSLALDAAPGTKLNLGDCLEKQGKIRSGWVLFEEAARDFDRLNDPRAKFAHERAAAAAAMLATLVIKVAEPTREGLAIRLGDRPATPQREIVERVDPGPIEIAVTAPGKATFSTSVVAAAGKTTVVDVPVLEDPRPLEAVSPAAEGTENVRHKRVVIAISLGVVGGVSLLGSLTLGLLAKSQYDGAFDDGLCVKTSGKPQCSPEGVSRTESAGTKADIGTGFGIAGVGLGIAAAIVYFTAPKEHVSITPTASASSVGLSFNARF